LTALCQVDGPRQLSRYRGKAEQVAAAVGASAEAIKRLSQKIGSALGTKRIHTASKALTARQAALPYDQDRIHRLNQLIAGLRGSAPQNRPVHDLSDPRHNYLPFFEAYFSNLIEGTEFVLDEAVAVVYDGRQIPGRGDDPTYSTLPDQAHTRYTARWAVTGMWRPNGCGPDTPSEWSRSPA
jgi:hypothetical protein